MVEISNLKTAISRLNCHVLPIAPDLLHREFSPASPNQVYVGDITYIPTQEGWLYLAVVIDLFSRQVVGW
jgi:putative transposase